MERETYYRLSASEKTFWYDVARMQGIKDLVIKYISRGSSSLKILDIGSGTGGTTDFLRQFGSVTGLESSDIATQLVQKNYPDFNIVKGNVENIDGLVSEKEFDLITVLNVLYHRNVKDPFSVLKNLKAKLKKNAWLMWNEPVYPLLIRERDEIVHGGRRFLPSQMHNLLLKNNFRICFRTHVSFLGFPVALMSGLRYRFMKRYSKSIERKRFQSIDLKPCNKHLNILLYYLARLEWRCAMSVLGIPIGVSYFILAQNE